MTKEYPMGLGSLISESRKSRLATNSRSLNGNGASNGTNGNGNGAARHAYDEELVDAVTALVRGMLTAAHG